MKAGGGLVSIVRHLLLLGANWFLTRGPFMDVARVKKNWLWIWFKLVSMIAGNVLARRLLPGR